MGEGMGSRMRLSGVAIAAGLAAVGAAGCASSPGFNPYGGAAVGISATVGRSAAGNYLAAQHAGLQRDNKAAAGYFERALGADPNNAAILERAFILAVADGEIGRAADFGRRIAAIDPDSRMARLILAVENLKARKYAAAGKEIDAASGRDADDVVWALTRAWIYAGENKIDEARAILASESTRKNLGAFALYHEALLLDFAGRSEAADKAYATAIIAADGRSARLLEAYGKFLLRNGRTSDAVKLYETYLKAVPDNPMVASLLASARASNAPARGLIATPVEGAAEALYGIAVVLAGERSTELPLVYLQLALYLRPDLDIGLALRGELYEAQEEWAKAVESFAAVPKGSPLEPYAAVTAARDLARLDRYEEASRILAVRVKEDPADIEALVAQGDLARAQEKWTEAANAYGRALDATGTNGKDRWQVLYAKGVSLERAGHWDQAEPLLQEALTLQPGQPMILNYLGYSWVDRGENLKEALTLIGRAVAASPEDGYIVDSLGWAYYRLGDYHNATKHLERAVELRPNDPTINDHLGDAYWKVGRKREARFQWNHALTFKPEPKDAERIARKLEHGLEDGAAAVHSDSRF